MTKSYTIRTPLIRVLIDEHIVILRALSVLDKTAKMMTKKRSPVVTDLRMLIRFFKEYADRIHHHSEEDVLFVALETNRSRTLHHMMEKLGTQHVIGRMLVGQMGDALVGARAGRRGWRQQFAENAVAYHALLSVHICDEDHIFFPAADKALMKMRPTKKLRQSHNGALKKKYESAVTRLVAKCGLRS